MGISMYDYQYISDRQERVISNEIQQIFLEKDQKVDKNKQQGILSLFHK